jgi:hypothetical protein
VAAVLANIDPPAAQRVAEYLDSRPPTKTAADSADRP